MMDISEFYKSSVKAQIRDMQDNLYTIRVQRGYSMPQLAKLTGISARSIFGIEHHETDGSLQMWLLLAAALDVQLSDLMKSPQANSTKSDS